MAQEVTREREQVRASVALTVRYAEPSDTRQLEGICLNLSRSGMFLGTRRPLPVGSLIKIECEMLDGRSHIRGVARVVWIRREAAGEQRPAGMGLRFLNLEAGAETLIDDLLARGDIGTAGRRGRSDPPSDTGDSQRPRLVPVAAMREVREVNAPLSADDSRGSGSSRPPSSRKSRDATQLRERWNKTRRFSKSDPPEGAQGTSSSNPPPARTTRPEVSSSPLPPPPAVPSESAPSTSQERPAEQTGAHPTRGASAKVAPPRPGGVDEAGEEALADDPQWRARRLAELIQTEAQRLPAATEGDAATEDGEVQEAVLVGGVADRLAGGGGRRLGLLTVGLVLGAGLLAFVLARAGSEPTATRPPGSERVVVPSPLADSTDPLLGDPAPAPSDSLPRGLDVPADTRGTSSAVPRDDPSEKPKSRSRASQSTSRQGSPGRKSAVSKAGSATGRSSAPQSAATGTQVDPARPSEKAPAPDGDAPQAEAGPGPLEAALQCLKGGDSACAVKALEGRARTAREWELLVESHRALGNIESAHNRMRAYLRSFPSGRRAATYRELLGDSAPAGAGGAQEAAKPPTAGAEPTPPPKGPAPAAPPAEPAPAE
jgi:uncharacterized protein (TIGR02266 family)